MMRFKKSNILNLAVIICSMLGVFAVSNVSSYAAPPVQPEQQIAPVAPGDEKTGTRDECGGVKTSIDFGCTNTSDPVKDFGFAIIRFLSAGVLFVLILMTVVAGIQYTTSNGDPGKVSQAKTKLLNIVIALFIYLFAFAIINYLVPGGFLT